MAINDALLSYLEEYENSRSEEDNTEEQIVEEDIIEEDEVSEETVDSHTSEEKPKFNKPFKFNLNSNKNDVVEQDDSSADEFLESIVSDVIASQPQQQKTQLDKVGNNQSANKIDVVPHREQKPVRDNSDTLRKMEKLLAEARLKSKKKDEEEQRLGVDSLDEHKKLMEAIHKEEGVSPAEQVAEEITEPEEQEELDIPNVSTEELMNQAETEYEDEWLEIYNKGLRSTKKNEVTSKIKRGRFRIDKDHQIEILADKRTDNKSADELLNEKWL